MSRSVNEVKLILSAAEVPESGGSSRSDSDTTFLLLFHPVHGCAAFVHFTNLVRLTSVEKDTLRRGGLTGIDVRHDTDIARQMEILLCHFVSMLLCDVLN